MDSTETQHSHDLVLIVDDEAANRALLGRMLQHEACSIVAAPDGESALAMARARLPDLILLDVVMPGRDGFEVCNELKADPATCHIPIIFLSVLADTAEKDRGLGLGAADYIAKPFDSAEVLARVRGQLKISGLTRDLIAANQQLRLREAEVESDLRAAADIQKVLLPGWPREAFPGGEVAWRCLPCDQVGGDLCNYYWLDRDHLAAYVIDVSGHGVPAAMLTVAIARSLTPPSASPRKAGISSAPNAAYLPGEFLRQLDRDYPMERFGRFFSMVYLVLNRRTGEFRYSNGGHPLPILLRADGGQHVLGAGGTVISCGAELPFEEGAERLAPGDTVLLYSDGVSECEGESGKLFAEHRLDEVLQKAAAAEASEICDSIIGNLVAYRGSQRMRDDVTVMAIRFCGSGSSACTNLDLTAAPANRECRA